ncbi:MAG TPA: sugar phosphate nucleotidyltransferase, partial [Methylomirabilota bacterium]|nr:sugar phosphate nucleotidyltransferase [Methylomirabilota bacterium]
WPRSRTRTPKQLLNIVGAKTMLQQTIARLAPVFPAQRIWTVTNAEQAAAVKKQLPAAARIHLLAEPVGRNTAAAIALAAFHVRRAAGGDALLGVLPADQYVADAARYSKIVEAALAMAHEPGRMVVLGIPPTRPDTGFGYIQSTGDPLAAGAFPAFQVRRFTEKPELAKAEEYLALGGFFWNAGMFFWRVSTFLDALKRFLPKTFAALEGLAESIGKPGYENRLRAAYRKLESISVDYAILEPLTNATDERRVLVIPAEIGWSDIGSWDAVYDLLAKHPGDNVCSGEPFILDATGNLFWSPGKFIAAIGVEDLVVVETPDALLVCRRDRAQDVAKVVKSLEQFRRNKLL